MKRNWILYCLPATLAVVSFSAMPAQAQVAALDGRVFVADAGEKGKAADEKNDVITFADACAAPTSRARSCTTARAGSSIPTPSPSSTGSRAR